MSGNFAIWAASLAFLSALVAVTRASVAHVLIWLLAMLLSLAACFFALGASFAGAAQVLIYAGAILAVFVFVVMTVDASPPAQETERARLGKAWIAPALVAVLLLAPLAGLTADPTTPQGRAVPATELGALLFGPWALAVEIASGLLLAALMGARHLGRRGRPEGRR
ncbi:NADH-quinone oxidoreductase subunit J [Rhodobacter sp. Har01]|uniref:NADH-quinone oxidoreductase subunit J n=1 Tax=Rhodobacter sp. Har01 TaxID=2883999 RepID=UPI001D0833EC|nr:NADH-quinone oxidoreductase subunit J [Rhodobacter sp. Har01]MCB6179927.1 NADH-quinone oxidoreductase subunit J [Rhodobacter sp. Har01]